MHSSDFLKLVPVKGQIVNGNLVLKTKLHNFTIKKVVFKPEKADKGFKPLKLKRTIKKLKEKDRDGYYAFEVLLEGKYKGKKVVPGQFTFHTNHPKQKTLVIKGQVRNQ